MNSNYTIHVRIVEYYASSPELPKKNSEFTILFIYIYLIKYNN